MAEKRDYYEVLGVAKTASTDEIKSAFKKLALKWHPDRWVSGTDAEKKTAEENFKEASEAYEVLSDPDKRAKYDQFGFNGPSGGFGGGAGGFSGFDINDILKDLFGAGFDFGGNGGGFGGFSGFGGFGGRGGSQQRVQRGRDIRTRVRLTLEEIAKGVTKEISIERYEQCPDCGGKGTKNESDIQTCPVCHGSGQRTVQKDHQRSETLPVVHVPGSIEIRLRRRPQIDISQTRSGRVRNVHDRTHVIGTRTLAVSVEIEVEMAVPFTVDEPHSRRHRPEPFPFAGSILDSVTL